MRKARKEPNLNLWRLVSDGAEEGDGYDEPTFIDAVERRLRDGRFLVLVILDGVQDGLEALTSYLQLHAGLRVSVALVELSVWEGVNGGLVVIPRIPLRTVLVERGIVRVDTQRLARVDAPNTAKATKPGALPKPYTASEPEFYDRLEQKQPGLANRLKPFLADLESTGITPEFGRSIVLRWYPSPNVQASAGYIYALGSVWLGDAVNAATRLGFPLAGTEYLNAVAQLLVPQCKCTRIHHRA